MFVDCEFGTGKDREEARILNPCSNVTTLQRYRIQRYSSLPYISGMFVSFP